MSENRVILGIDPGTKRIGFGVVKASGKEFTFLDAGLLKPKEQNFIQSAEELLLLLEKYRPEIMAIEKVYFSKNIRSAISVSEIKGALTLKAEDKNVKVIEISPTEVKSILTGYGQADKVSIRKMVFSLLGQQKNLKSKDAVDALAIAIAGDIKSKAEKIFNP